MSKRRESIVALEREMTKLADKGQMWDEPDGDEPHYDPDEAADSAIHEEKI